MIQYENASIGMVLRRAAEKWADKTAVASADQRVSFFELYQKSLRLASGLSKIGVGKGDSVATLFGTAMEWLYVKYALHIIGAQIVPLNVNFRAKEISFILKQADVKTLIMNDKLKSTDYLSILTEIDPEIFSSGSKEIKSNKFPFLQNIVCYSPEKYKHPFCHDYSNMIEEEVDFDEEEMTKLLERTKPDDIANVLFTSGSTAFPKGAMHTHKSLLGIGDYLLGQTFQLQPTHNLLCYFPFYHIAGCVYFALGALIHGCFLYVNEFIPEEILSIISKEKINLYAGFEAHFNSLLACNNFKEYDLSSIKFILLATGPEWYDKCRSIFPKVELIAHHYGFSEGTGVSMPPDEQRYEIRKFTNGKPWPGISIKVVDPATGIDLAPGQPGEICLKGWSRFQGYYKNEEETAKAIDSEEYFHSGDYGWLDNEGNLFYRGRIKTMIKTGGENVSEREVEIFLEAIPGVKSVQVVGLPDEKWGEAVTAIIEAEAGTKLNKDQVAEFCKDKIAGFKIPKRVLFIDGQDWPLLGAGKIDKRKLKEWAAKKTL